MQTYTKASYVGNWATRATSDPESRKRNAHAEALRRAEFRFPKAAYLSESPLTRPDLRPSRSPAREPDDVS